MFGLILGPCVGRQRTDIQCPVSPLWTKSERQTNIDLDNVRLVNKMEGPLLAASYKYTVQQTAQNRTYANVGYCKLKTLKVGPFSRQSWALGAHLGPRLGPFSAHLVPIIGPSYPHSGQILGLCWVHFLPILNIQHLLC
jgi:hypothetical protein